MIKLSLHKQFILLGLKGHFDKQLYPHSSNQIADLILQYIIYAHPNKLSYEVRTEYYLNLLNECYPNWSKEVFLNKNIQWLREACKKSFFAKDAISFEEKYLQAIKSEIMNVKVQTENEMLICINIPQSVMNNCINFIRRKLTEGEVINV